MKGTSQRFIKERLYILFCLNSHSPGCHRTVARRDFYAGPSPNQFHFQDTFPSSFQCQSFQSLCALLGLTSAWVARGKIYFHNFLWRVFHRRRIVPSEIFTRAVDEARNPPASLPKSCHISSKSLTLKKKWRKTYHHFSLVVLRYLYFMYKCTGWGDVT